MSVDGDLFKVTLKIKCLRVEKPSGLPELVGDNKLTDDNGNSSDSPDADGISGSNESDNANPNTQN